MKGNWGADEAGQAPCACLLHITDWKTCLIQIHWVAIFFLRVIFYFRALASLFSHFGSWFSWRNHLDLEVPWFDLGKRVIKSLLIHGEAWDQRVAMRVCGMWGSCCCTGRVESVFGFWTIGMIRGCWSARFPTVLQMTALIQLCISSGLSACTEKVPDSGTSCPKSLCNFAYNPL